VRFIVEEGYNRGQEYSLDKRGNIIGRDADCEIQILEEGISRRHAEICVSKDEITVQDLKSRNGIRLNGLVIDQASLVLGDRLSLGKVRLLLVAKASSKDLEFSVAALERATQSLELDRRSGTFSTFEQFEILGQSEGLRELLGKIKKVAPSRAAVLILGESGTGKELMAHALHRLSPRRTQPFVVLNCAALPAELIESELFGHEKGAFTGALGRKMGLTEAANKGALFLDELGELPLAAQAKLLRFLQSGEIKRVGATKTIKSDVRLLAATHRDIPDMVAHGSFREDLYFRLQVIELKVPALRDRGEDRIC
jgi:transcriptional regulator with GAF, ATPase, and Fis domain